MFALGLTWLDTGVYAAGYSVCRSPTSIHLPKWKATRKLIGIVLCC